VKLRLENITAEVKDISFTEPEADINRILRQGPIREYRVERPIEAKVSFYRAGTDVFIEGSLVARIEATCARCAEEFDASSERSFRYVLAPKVLGDEADGGLTTEDLEYSLYSGDEIDLSPLIYEQLQLALPTRPLCREDCRGLCPRCGANLNRGDCGCRAESFDPRLARLRELKLRSR
jgi:DUF177 domain-containing protein